MWQTIGQDRIVNSLKKGLLEGRFSHAYLFVGPQHVGKMTLATDFAQALNCASGENPCGECDSCRRTKSGRHSDVQILQLAEGNDDQAAKKTIGVEQIREMQHSVNLKPFEGGYRIIIIDGAEHMSDGAANSLLKTLEEPPPSTVFVLLAVNEDSLLSTILSRCQKLELNPLPAQTVQQSLVDQWEVSPENAKLLARLCHGCIGWALSAVRDESIVEDRSLNLESMIFLAGADISDRFDSASSLATLFGKSRVLVKERLGLWLIWWRDVLLAKNGCEEFIVNIDREDEICSHARRLSVSAIGGAIKSIQEAMQQLEKNANPRLALEMMMLNIPVFEVEENYA